MFPVPVRINEIDIFSLFISCSECMMASTEPWVSAFIKTLSFDPKNSPTYRTEEERLEIIKQKPKDFRKK